MNERKQLDIFVVANIKTASCREFGIGTIDNKIHTQLTQILTASNAKPIEFNTWLNDLKSYFQKSIYIRVSCKYLSTIL